MGSIADKLKGKAKQVEGRLTGDKVRETQGTVEKAKGDIEGAVERTADRVRGHIDRKRDEANRNRR